MTQTGVLKVRQDGGGWENVGFPNAGGGALKIHDGSMWHVADNAAIERTGRLKVRNASGAWQHVSWMRAIPLLILRGSSAWDVFGFDPSGPKPLALPAATQLGDLMVLSLSPHSWVMSDGRFTSYGHGAYVGYATDLSPVDLARTYPGSGQAWAQASLLVFVGGEATVTSTSYVASSSSPFAMPVVSGVQAAVACVQGTTSTVHGYTVPDAPWIKPGAAWSTSAGYAGVAYWDDPGGSGTPAVDAIIYGSGPNAGVTVIGLV